jgi:hypothetical protein
VHADASPAGDVAECGGNERFADADRPESERRRSVKSAKRTAR